MIDPELLCLVASSGQALVLNYFLQSSPTTSLVERVSPGAPPGEEHAQTDGLEDTGEDTNGNNVSGALLLKDLGDEL